MTYQVLAGALVGLGLFLLIRALVPTKPDAVSAVAGPRRSRRSEPETRAGSAVVVLFSVPERPGPTDTDPSNAAP